MRHHMLRVLAPLALTVPVAACIPGAAPAQDPDIRSPTPKSTPGVVRAETYASGLVNPWALAFMPDGRLLVTERPGRLRIVAKDGSLSAPLSGVPRVHASGQGGLLDVALDPAFSVNRLVYLSYAEPDDSGRVGTAVARGKLGESGLENVEVIYRQRPKMRGGNHYGSRLVFDRDGTIFVTQGDRQAWRDSAQSLTAGLGKIVRIYADGKIPRNNPFINQANVLPEIWSYGHRNLQGAVRHPETGQLWTVEHGAYGGDELNHPEAGKNYGWPVITYGVDYSGRRIGEGSSKAGMEQPVYYWDPVIAPSGLMVYTGDAFPGWTGNFIIGSLSPGGIVRLVMENGRVVREERYLGELRERIRDVQQGPDGFIYAVTDNGAGRVLRIVPLRTGTEAR